MTSQIEIDMIRDSARAFTHRGGNFARVRNVRFTKKGFDTEAYREMASMGWLMLRLPEEVGGLGLGMRAYCALSESLGAGLNPEPLIQANLAIRLMGSAADEKVLSGAKIVLPAWQSAWDGLNWEEGISFNGGNLTGEKRFIANAAGADAFLVTFASGAALIDAMDSNASLDCEGTQDGGHFGRLTMKDVTAIAVDLTDIEAAFDEAILATSAYLLGVAETAFEMTLDYLRVRNQFGKPIGSFQSLQHRATDMKTQIELLRASVNMAASTLDAGAGVGRRAAVVSQAKARATDTAMLISREAIQMHGAIGFTDEHDIGLFVRKAMTLSNQFGSAAFHRRRFAQAQPYLAA